MSRSAKKSRPAGQNRPAARLKAVVMLSYGPRSSTRGLTKAMARTCAALGVSLVDVPALDPETGRPGSARGRLFEALSQLDSGPILFIHDDVAIDDASLDRLVEAHLAGASVAVPSSNDTGTHHFHGSLPQAAVARSELKKLSRVGDGSYASIETFRPACFVAERATVVRLLDQRIHDPFTLVADRGIGVQLVSGAFAAHDGACGKQVRSAVASPERPILVASMIVKNEESMLAGCLESLEDLVDRVEVVDTGSTDATVEIARSHGANVTQVEWRDDFAWARNQAADLCRDAMFTLWIDADERVATANPAMARDLLAACFDEIEAFDVRLANHSQESGEPSSVVRLRRIVRSDLLAFAGRVHEQPVRLGDQNKALEAATFDALGLDHFGYAKDVIDKQGKRERNLRLAKAQHADDNSLKASVDLARSLLMSGDNSGEAISLLRDAVAALEESGETRPDWTAYLYGSLAHVLLNNGQTEEAHDWSSRAFDLLPNDDLAAAVMCTAALDLGREAHLVEVIGRFYEPAKMKAVFESAQNVRVVEESTAMAQARVGDTEEAWARVETWFIDGRDFTDATWEVVAEVACLHFDVTELADVFARLAAEHRASGLIRRCSALLAPEVTASLAVVVLESGQVDADSVSTGLASALVSTRWDLFDQLVEFVDEVEPSVRDHLASRLEALGESDRAHRTRSVAQPARQGGFRLLGPT